MTVGYIVGTHRVYETPLRVLLESMFACGIGKEQIVIVSNGAEWDRLLMRDGIKCFYQRAERASHFIPIASGIADLQVSHWFYLHDTSKCGPKFRELIESGFDADADATLAGGYYGLEGVWGGDFPVHHQGRANLCFAMYRHDFLARSRSFVESFSDVVATDAEGRIFQRAVTKAHYPVIGNYQVGPWWGEDVYGTGLKRQARYFPGLDLFRYVKWWGQPNPNRGAAV